MTTRAQQAFGQFQPGGHGGDVVAHARQRAFLDACGRRWNGCDGEVFRGQRGLQQAQQFLALCRTQGAQALTALKQVVEPSRGGWATKSSARESSRIHERGLSKVRALASRHSSTRRNNAWRSRGQSAAPRKARCGCGSACAPQMRSTRRRQSSLSQSVRPSAASFSARRACNCGRWATSCAA